jgi:Adenylate and Guanylate cyclase catalytic domain
MDFLLSSQPIFLLIFKNNIVVPSIQAIYLGEDDNRESFLNDTSVDQPMLIYHHPETLAVRGHCTYTFSFYASSHFFEQNQTDLPMIFTILVSVIFIATSMTFCMYDAFVRRRNAKVLDAAAESNAIISSLFPTNVRGRLFEEAKQKAQLTKKGKKTGQAAAKSQLKNMITNGNMDTATKCDVDDLIYAGKPIADLFPETTILFADIAGFTAWSSVREPSQVFILLETLYHAFDEVAKSRRVFKVETVVSVACPDDFCFFPFSLDSSHKHEMVNRETATWPLPDCRIRAKTTRWPCAALPVSV